MNISKIISRHVKKLTSGKSAAVVIPMATWKQLFDKFEQYEDLLAMSTSKSYTGDIARARKSKKEILLATLMKKYGVT